MVLTCVGPPYCERPQDLLGPKLSPTWCDLSFGKDLDLEERLVWALGVESICVITFLLPRERAPGQLFHKRKVSKMPPILGKSQVEIPFKSSFLDITLCFPRRIALQQIRTPVASCFKAKSQHNPKLIRLIYRANYGVISYADTL